MMEQVILVNEQDEPQGLMEKMEAHRKAELHRAFSVFIFHPDGRMLIHQRAESKYHSGGLWTNACCSHPRNGEGTEAAAHRRLQEEMGFDCPVKHRFHFIYKTPLDQGLYEHELDHVFTGEYDGEITPDPEEVMDWKYVDIEKLKASMEMNPEDYTVWFRIAFPKVIDFLGC